MTELDEQGASCMTEIEERIATDLVNGDFHWEKSGNIPDEQVFLGMIARYRRNIEAGDRRYPWKHLIQVASRRINREPVV